MALHSHPAVSWAARVIGLPPGTGELLTPATRRRLQWSAVGSFALSLLDMAGVLAMVPMMQYVTGQSLDSGALGVLNRLLGRPEPRSLVLVLAAAIVGAFVVKDLASIVFRRWQMHFLADEQVRISTQVLEGYLTGPYAWHLTKNTGDKLWTVQGAVSMGLVGGLSGGLAALTESLTIGFVLLSMLLISPLATVAAVVYFGVAGLVILRLIRPRIVEASQRTQIASRALGQASLQALGAVKEIKLRHAHGPFLDTFTTSGRAGARAGATAALLGEVPKYFLEVVFVLGVGVLAVAATTNNSSQEGLLLIGVFVAAGTRVLPSAVRLINATAMVRYAEAPLAHLVSESRMQRIAAAQERDLQRTDRVPSGDIEVRGIEFAYADAPDALVLRGVDLTIPAGRTVAIVGSSGAGKSTLVDLLLGLHQPSAGRICAGGVDISHNLAGWQRRLAVVPQEVYLLDDTLGANIAFDETPDDERLADVVERAQLGDLVRSLPGGLDSEVGERGVRLSGGQRQRIGIARALYRRPEVLFLDEATSALDNETERRLTETILALHGSMTMVIVAHRLSTVQHCDSLLFMSDGLVASTGTFGEVAATNQEFAHLVALGRLDV